MDDVKNYFRKSFCIKKFYDSKTKTIMSVPLGKPTHKTGSWVRKETPNFRRNHKNPTKGKQKKREKEKEENKEKKEKEAPKVNKSAKLSSKDKNFGSEWGSHMGRNSPAKCIKIPE